MSKISEKKVLWISASVLILSGLLLIGATYAWFTAEVVSSNNIIKTGNLSVEMEYNDGSLNTENKQVWKNLSVENEPIFNLHHLEPGFRAVRYFKISNKGNLAFKYQVDILAQENYEELGDVIDVYLIRGESKLIDNFDETTMQDYYVGTLSSVIKSSNGLAAGIIYPNSSGSSDYTFDNKDLAFDMVQSEATLILKMREKVSNDLMNKSIDNNFTISLHASQFSYENDDLDSTYDASATHGN